MGFRRYYEVKDFLDKALAYLEEDEATNNLMIGICLRLRDGGSYGEDKPYFATVENENGLVIAAVMTPPRPICIYGQGYDTEAIETLAENLMKDNIQVPAVIGEKTAAEEFARIWSEKNNIDYKVEMNLRVYRLDKVEKVNEVSGYFRQAGIEDKKLVAAWICSFNEDAHLDGMSYEEALHMAETKIKDGDIYLWEDGEAVSMAASSRKTPNGVVVSLVYTPKEHRGKGYASACVANLSQVLLDRGNKFCALFTDLANPTSNSIYMKMGYKPVSDFDNCSFHKKEMK